MASPCACPLPLPAGAQGGAARTWPLLLPLHGQDTLAQLAVQPELHPDEGFAAFLGELAPRLRPRQHVTDTALGQAQYLEGQPQTCISVRDSA